MTFKTLNKDIKNCTKLRSSNYQIQLQVQESWGENTPDFFLSILLFYGALKMGKQKGNDLMTVGITTKWGDCSIRLSGYKKKST